MDVEIPALHLLMKLDENPDLTYTNRLLDMQEAQLDREINKGDLVIRYDSRLDFTFKTRFVTKWKGPYLVVQMFANASYQLADLDGSLHKNGVNGLRLKKYVVRIMQVSSCGRVIMKTK